MNRSLRYLQLLSRGSALALAAALAGCAASGGAHAGGRPAPEPAASAPPAEPWDEQETPAPRPSGPEQSDAVAVTVTVGDTAYAATLEDNETVRALAGRFPLTLEMRELNGNEKYFYLDGSLPTDAYQPGQIRAGDLMLYGDSCLVLFYESFSSGYSYTALGSLDDPSGLAEAAGPGSVTVTFELAG